MRFMQRNFCDHKRFLVFIWIVFSLNCIIISITSKGSCRSSKKMVISLDVQKIVFFSCCFFYPNACHNAIALVEMAKCELKLKAQAKTSKPEPKYQSASQSIRVRAKTSKYKHRCLGRDVRDVSWCPWHWSWNSVGLELVSKTRGKKGKIEWNYKFLAIWAIWVFFLQYFIHFFAKSW